MYEGVMPSCSLKEARGKMKGLPLVIYLQKLGVSITKTNRFAETRGSRQKQNLDLQLFSFIEGRELPLSEVSRYLKIAEGVVCVHVPDKVDEVEMYQAKEPP